MRRLEKSLQNIKDELSGHVADMRNLEWESMTADEYSCECEILRFHEATRDLLPCRTNQRWRLFIQIASLMDLTVKANGTVQARSIKTCDGKTLKELRDAGQAFDFR